MITQTPQATTEDISTISWVGDVYQIDGEEYDFTQLLEGEVLPVDAVGCRLIVSDVMRIGTELNFTYVRQYKHTEDSLPEDTHPQTLDNKEDSL